MNPVRNLTAAAMADPLHQTINLIRADGLSVAVDLSIVDMDRTVMVSTSIAYGVEIGASLVMLAVILTMTPKTKFWRLPTYLNIASLCNNVVRVMLLALYFDSSWVTFYTLYALDDRYVSKTDVAITVASTIFSLPQNILVMSALMLQAWSMVKLWPRFYKWGILCFSVVLVLFEIGFRGASMAYGMMQVNMSPQEAFYLMNRLIWVRQYFLGLEVACICWFCFLFISKLATHLWKNRSFLPTTKGLGAMDALVMTNGVLMLIPGRSLVLLRFPVACAMLTRVHSLLRQFAVLSRWCAIRSRLHGVHIRNHRPPAGYTRCAAHCRPRRFQQPAEWHRAHQQ